MSHAPGSLADYDILISISDDAINRQLKQLYDHALESDDFPAPGEVDGAANPAQTQYLINHELVIHINDENGNPDAEAGLDAHVESPKVSFTDVTPDDHRSVRIIFKFKEDASAPVPNSVFKYRQSDGDAPTEVVVNGYSMSWLASIQNHPINNVQEALINPSADKESPVKLSPGLVSTLSAGVTASGAQVISNNTVAGAVWCQFTADQMTSSFKLTDDKDNAVDDQQIIGPLTKAVVTYYTGLKTQPGITTPDNPFVLGYGITQKAAADDARPPYFVPKSCDLTTSAGVDPSPGTLNYCLLTHRADGDAERTTSPESNPLAGVPETPLFSTTKATSGDGVLGLCQDIMFPRYIVQTIGEALWLNSSTLLHSPDEGFSLDDEPPAALQTTAWSRASTFRTNYRNVNEGANKVDVTYDSVLVRAGESALASDAKRSGTITVDLTAQIDVVLETVGKVASAVGEVASGLFGAIGGIFGSPHPDPPIDYTTQARASITWRYRIVIDLGAGEGGIWTITRDDEGSKPQLDDDGKLVTQQVDNLPSDGYGAWLVNKDDSGQLDKVWGSSADMTSLLNEVKGFGDDSVNAITSKLTDLGKSCSSMVVMPGGETFMFTGIDTDVQGHLYSHISLAATAVDAAAADGAAS